MRRLTIRQLALCLAMLPLMLFAQERRYVMTAEFGGSNSNDGHSWATAKADIQEAINDLVNNNLTGEVWVAQGTYYPTETTESSSNPLYKSFKIPAGITVRGGFLGKISQQDAHDKLSIEIDEDYAGEQTLDDRQKISDSHFGHPTSGGTLDGEPTKGGVFKFKTVLSGSVNATNKEPDFSWNTQRKVFDATFYGNSYHVVYFAMRGFDSNGRANALTRPAKLEGCVIQGGNAFNNDITANHPHTAYGGGIYMVKNSFVYNCEVRNCAASRDGGGIYMDGGGIVRRTYVHDCQTLGVGTEFGRGGGICEDDNLNSKAVPIVVAQSAVTNCVGRMGGGMALIARQINDNKYAIVANSTLVNNNTATTEAGGVYTEGGGGLASMTIARNQCNGSGITVNGAMSGRSGGVYSHKEAYVGNCVIWGNECAANLDIQYATSRNLNASAPKSLFLYNALSNQDLVDWTSVEKMNVLSLDNANSVVPAQKGKKGYPIFFYPTESAGYTKNYKTQPFDVLTDGKYDPSKHDAQAPGVSVWAVSSESSLSHAGINTSDLDTRALTPAPTGVSYDMKFGVFNARPTIGAYIAQVETVEPREGDDKLEYFVDPNFIYSEDNPLENGKSWDKPARFLGDVLDIINRQNNSRAAGDKTIYVYVKEGTVDNTRTADNALHVRTTALDIPSNVHVIGSFDKTLTGTDLSRRNPVLTPTIYSAQLMQNYDYNLAHLINIKGQKNITIDGLKLSFANAHSTKLSNDNTNGAAIVLKNCVKGTGEDDEINIHFINITISNCYGDKGTVVYADNSTADFENCIFHNNTTATIANSGLIYSVNGSDLRFNHCNVLRSVGHASYIDASSKNDWKNSMFYGNLDRAQDNTNNCNTLAIPAFEGPGVNSTNLTGSRCMFDLVSKPLYDNNHTTGINLGAGIPATSTYYVRTVAGDPTTTETNPNGLEYAYTSGWANGYPRMVNPTKNAGYSIEGDVTYYGRSTSFEPHNDNPVVNAGGTYGESHIDRSWGTDITSITTRDFGGLPDIGAVESHIASFSEQGTENANPDGQKRYGVAYYVRDYAQNDMPMTYTLSGGVYTSQTGANKGKGNYVKEGDDYIFLDGASWQYAVSGNALYSVGTIVEKDVVTHWKSTEVPEQQTFKGTFKIRTSGGRYITISNNAINTTTNANNAVEWTVSGITSATEKPYTIDDGNHTVSARVNNATYYLSVNAFTGNPQVSTTSYTPVLTSVTGGYTIKSSRSDRWYRWSNNTLSTTTNQENATAWVFDPVMETIPGGWQETYVPSDKVTTDVTVTSGSSVYDSLALHVYTDLSDITNIGTENVVSYKIKLRNSDIWAYNYTRNGNQYLRSTNAVGTSNNFVLIASDVEGLYYIYDISTNRYVYNNGSNSNPIQLHATNRTAWKIKKDASDNAFNIINPDNDAQSWKNNGNGTSVTYDAPTSGTATEWVLVAQKDYTNKYYRQQSAAGGTLNGLQYAVNTVYDEYISTGEQHSVHVAKGVYTNATAANSESVSQPYAYMMKEGVDVLGGYPYIGNPGEQQREPKQFETILQPQENSPYVTFNRESSGGNYHLTVSNWGANAKFTDGAEAVSVGRVLVQPTNFTEDTKWDGFTLRHGYLMTAYMQNIGSALTSPTVGQGLNPDEAKQAGGAGVLLQEKGILTNCVVSDNLILCAPRNANMIKSGDHTNATSGTYNLYTHHMAGAGIFMTGTSNAKGLCTGNGAIVENCVVSRNQIVTKSQSSEPDHLWMYGGGVFQNGGQMYNTIVHDNDMITAPGSSARYSGSGGPKDGYTNEMILGAVFIASGNSYNNTVVNNFASSLYSWHNNHCTFSGIHVFDEARIYNSLIADNASRWYYGDGVSPGNGVPVSAFKDDESARTSRQPAKVHVLYSFVDVNKGAKDNENNYIDLVSQNDHDPITNAQTNIYLNKAQDGTDASYTTGQMYYKAGASGTTADNIYTLKSDSKCINAGLNNIDGVTIPDFDAAYSDRIQDCRIDIGAYESNGAVGIKAQTITADKQYVFYVTPEGNGNTSGDSPKNAACAPKLQKVLDAAGRLKLQHPNAQVIVKVANSYDMYNGVIAANKAASKKPGDDGYVDPTNFTYYATRTTDQASTDTRLWSIMVPRGVEVWGGYTDVPVNESTGVKTADTWDDTHNGFVKRDITKYPTYFDSYFYNKDMMINATTYHVVTFTERVYDTDGVPYLATDYSAGTLAAKSSYSGSAVDESLYLHMSDVIAKTNVILAANGTDTLKIGGKTVSNRAVVDGIFITGGNADGKVLAGTSSLNANGYGGAAIVTDYAYVRNCIVKGNSASNGGAFALTNGALVSGSLIIENFADNKGGGLYFFENGDQLSNGITVKTDAPDGQALDYNMAHVFTSTIVANEAQQGGGVWFTTDDNPNARLNSVAIWQNIAPDQAQVYGSVTPEQDTEDETVSELFFPFAYSLIQNIRASGTNNISGLNKNNHSVRFVAAASDGDHDAINKMAVEGDENADVDVRFADFGYYGLTNYSRLCSTGMPKSMYKQLQDAIAISDIDLLGAERMHETSNFVEIGARALAKTWPNKQLMLRLFVANEGDTDTDLASRFANLDPESNKTAEYYTQEGSSFAYPFNSLQDALDYIVMARNGKITGNTDAQNLPFEILVGKGYYYPRHDLNGETKSVWSATFAVPEGVSIIGGFNPLGGGNTSFYGRYYEPVDAINTSTPGSIDANVTPIPTGSAVPETPGVTEIGRGNKYGEESVTLPCIEGEDNDPRITFQQWHLQDIADRRAMNDNNQNGIIEPWEFFNPTIISGNAINNEHDGVYHVMTAVADAAAVGKMPKVQETNGHYQADSYHWYEKGQQVRLNGLIITGGNALTYLESALDEYGKYIFYQGAGLQVDGNRYRLNASDAHPDFKNSGAYGVGYRDIPVLITNCQFLNNIAGYGGAISSNGSLSIFASSFERNMALAQTETPGPGETWTTKVSGTPQTVSKVMYPGQGGAILATNQLSAFNTLFANNEARLGENEEETIATVKHPTFRVPNENQASSTVRAAGGAIMMGSAAQHHIVNCDFVRNKANMYPAVFTMNPTYVQSTDVDTHKYSQIINTVAWGNEVNPEFYNQFKSNASYAFASKLFVNVGKKNRNGAAYTPAFDGTNTPASQTALDGGTEGNPNYSASEWQEAAWFCAYEDGTGFTQNNTNDLRHTITYVPNKFAPDMIAEANSNVYQNCNISIVADNNDIAGPNFGTPSITAGYDGFMPSADWSPARVNRLTDNANGWIKQSVDPATHKVTFQNEGVAGTNFQGAYSVTHYISKNYGGVFPEYLTGLAIGSEKYMQATNDAEDTDVSINGTQISPRPNKNMPRISGDPTPGAQYAYIDIGVYEYIKQPLFLGNEVDILWVSTKERPENGPANGSRWEQPTSDLQRAIESLLASRNGHKKEIRIMEGEYTPVDLYQPGGDGTTRYQAFHIDTKSLNESVIAPSNWTSGTKEKFFAQSLTIKGGYSQNMKGMNDPEQYKTIIRQHAAKADVNTDYLFYIADPVQRYAYKMSGGKTDTDYTSGNNYGAGANPKTMPIQIDGVTLINDLVQTDNKKGSVIYYHDVDAANLQTSPVSVGGEIIYYKNKEEFMKEDPDTHVHTGQTTTEETAFPLITGGTTKENAPKLIISKTQVVGSGKAGENTHVAGHTDASAVYIGQYGGSALIYNSVFHTNNGMPLDAWNTVNVNNTFALNKGIIKLQDLSYSATTTNEGTVPVAKSQIHNSAIWENNGGGTQFSVPGISVNATTKAVEIESGTLADIFSYNAFTGGNVESVDYTPSAGHAIYDNAGNAGLVSENRDLMYGPNFIDPDNEDVEARSFDLRPSVRLLNRGNGTRKEHEPATNPVTYDYAGLYNTKIIDNTYDFSLVANTLIDVIGDPRIIGGKDNSGFEHIDVGAYEFQGALQQIMYVDPNKSHAADATGENWEKSFGYGDIQDAIDLAGIYHMTNPTQEGYVFVKGNSSTNAGKNSNETLTLRDGVKLYGSIMSSSTDWHGTWNDDSDHSKGKKFDDDPENYITDLRQTREGVASTHANTTIVKGIKVDKSATYNGTTNNTPVLVDGVKVTDPDNPSTPVVDITSTSENGVFVLRNIIVADNEMQGGANVAEISNGLIYEALFHDNHTTGAALRVSNGTNTKGYAVNVTVEGKTIGADYTGGDLLGYDLPIDGKHKEDDGMTVADVEAASQIYNSITNSVDGKNNFGAYGKIVNKGISGYYYNIGRNSGLAANESTNADLNYQLSETSHYIDICDEGVNPMTTAGATNLAPFIDYKTDRDILGNPRVLAGVTSADAGARLDRGAFETWLVENDWHSGHDNSITNVDGYQYAGDGACCTHDGAGNITAINDVKLHNVKRCFYPHAGSVVYVMAGHYICPDAPYEGYDETTSNPGFLLLKEGASWYGKGRHTTLAYVAVERKVKRAGEIVALPYAMKYNKDVATVTDPFAKLSENLVLTHNAPQNVSRYNGDSRSDWRYSFSTADSPCWTPVTGENESVNATQGVFFQPANGADANAIYRFTAQGNNIGDFIYVENTVSKSVTLTKNDDDENTNNKADYTDNLNMGWNCIGIPFLVNDYKPYQKVNVENAEKRRVVVAEPGTYSMNIPHTLWLYYDHKNSANDKILEEPNNTAVNGDGGYYSVDAWKGTYNDGAWTGDAAAWHVSNAADARIWVGEGIFTQTATHKDSESLEFMLPVAPAFVRSPGGSAPLRSNVRYYYDGPSYNDDPEEVEEPIDLEDPEATIIATEYYTPGGVRLNAPQKGIVIIRNIYSNGKSKSSKKVFK